MPMKRKTITLDADLLKKIKRIAKKEDRSFSNMIQRIIVEWLDALYTSDT